jgi:hypothetical protein
MVTVLDQYFLKTITPRKKIPQLNEVMYNQSPHEATSFVENAQRKQFKKLVIGLKPIISCNLGLKADKG